MLCNTSSKVAKHKEHKTFLLTEKDCQLKWHLNCTLCDWYPAFYLAEVC